jgi:hypothetical protein
MMAALITSRKSPNVISVIGIVRMMRMGRRKAFMNPISKATSTAVGKPAR